VGGGARGEGKDLWPAGVGKLGAGGGGGWRKEGGPRGSTRMKKKGGEGVHPRFGQTPARGDGRGFCWGIPAWGLLNLEGEKKTNESIFGKSERFFVMRGHGVCKSLKRTGRARFVGTETGE